MTIQFNEDATADVKPEDKADKENYIYSIELQGLRPIIMIAGIILLVIGFLVIILEVAAGVQEYIDYLVTQHLMNIGLGIGIQILGIGMIIIAKK